MKISYNENFDCVKEYIKRCYKVGQMVSSSELLHGIEKEYNMNVVTILRYLKWFEKMGYLMPLPKELSPIKKNKYGKPPKVYVLVKIW